MAIQVLAKKAIQKVVKKAVEKAGEKVVEKGVEKAGSKVAEKAGSKAGKNLMRKRMAEIGSRNPDDVDAGGDLQTESIASMPDKQVRTNQFKEDPEKTIARSRELRAELDSPMMRALKSPEEKEHNQRQYEAVEAGATSFEDGAARQYIDPKQFREAAVSSAWDEETQKLETPKDPEPRTDLSWEGRGKYSYNLNLDDPSSPSVRWTHEDGQTGVWTPEDKVAWDSIMKERTEQLGGVTPASTPKPEPKSTYKESPAPMDAVDQDVPAKGESVGWKPGMSYGDSPEVATPESIGWKPEPAQETGRRMPAMEITGSPAPEARGTNAALEIVQAAKAEGTDPTSVSRELQALAEKAGPEEAQQIRGIINDYVDYAGGEVARKAQARSNPPNVRMAAME